MKPPLAALTLVCALAVTANAADPKRTAAQILGTARIQGGLIVHVGCGDGKLTAALRANDGFLVHGLDAEAKNVEAARKHIQSLGIYGPVSAERFDGKRLPYIDNLVNLIVAEDLGNVSHEELMRVLCPNGVAYVNKQGQGRTDLKSVQQWTKTVKPRPPEIDEWTHYLHDATNNAVAQDMVVGPPRHLQWIGSPRWSRHHDHMASTSAMVSAGGRVFYIFDEGPTSSIQLPPRWALVARDAMNGVILWKRPVSAWHPHLWKLKSGPAQLPRRLVAADDRVYVTLALDGPLVALEAATGRIVRTFEGTRATEEILCSEGVLFLLVNEKPLRYPAHPKEFAYDWPEGPRAILAVRAETGEMLWKTSCPWVATLTLTADRRHLYFHDGRRIVCLDRRAGRQRWASEPLARASPMPSCYGPTLVAYQDVILFCGGENLVAHRGAKDRMVALSADDGKLLWSAEHPPSGYQSPEDILVAGGLVWTAPMTSGGDSGVFTGRDPRTGEVKIQFAPDDPKHMPHHRCHRAKATEKYLLASRTGIECVDFRAKHWIPHHWVRGGCLYGIMPANGLIYTPPHDCACYVEAKLSGFCALAAASSARDLPARLSDDDRLQRGPAYSLIPRPQSPIPSSADWPTYRHDAARSGFTPSAVPAGLRSVWATAVGGKPSSLTIAGGKVFAAIPETHALCALDAASGRVAWRYAAGGRIDSPPTVWGGHVLFGAADGHVCCLRAADGQVAWRFRAAPIDRRIVANEQIESVWPVHGSVLVHEGVVWCVAGRSMFLDGGMRLLRLDAATGRKLSETVLEDRHPETGRPLQAEIRWPALPVALPDVLSCDGKTVYLRSQRFDLSGNRPEVKARLDAADQQGEGSHLFSPTGFLDDSWWHRSYWIYGKTFLSGAGGWLLAGQHAPAGRILAFDQSRVYGFGRRPEHFRWTTAMEYHLFAADKEPRIVTLAEGKPAPPGEVAYPPGLSAAKRRGQVPPTRFVCHWSKTAPVQARAMVLAADTLFVAGPSDVVEEESSLQQYSDPAVQKRLTEQAAALEGRKGALLMAVSAAEGKLLSAYRLDAPPVFDGMAAAEGRLFLSTTDGKVLCLGGGEGQPLPRVSDVEIADTPPSASRAGRAIQTTKTHPDFTDLAQVEVTSCELGYRLRAASGDVGLAIRRLPEPLTGKARLKLRLRMIPNDASALPPANGFLVFGDAPSDDRLVKCGLRSRGKRCMIVQGPLLKGKAVDRPIEPKVNEVLDLVVTVDLARQTVAMTLQGQTVEAPLERRLEAVTFVGYCVHSVATEFGPIQTEDR